MERYIFFDPDRIPPGLYVVGVPTPSGLVWVEITAAEYAAASADPAAALHLVKYAREVLASRLRQAEEPRV
jgi:hypothetical protein